MRTRTKLLVSFLGLLLASASTAASATFEPDQPTVLITGANRGLGLEFARQGCDVIASCGQPRTGKSISAEESEGYVIERIALLDETMPGKLITYDGKVIPL